MRSRGRSRGSCGRLSLRADLSHWLGASGGGGLLVLLVGFSSRSSRSSGSGLILDVTLILVLVFVGTVGGVPGGGVRAHDWWLVLLVSVRAVRRTVRRTARSVGRRRRRLLSDCLSGQRRLDLLLGRYTVAAMNTVISNKTEEGCKVLELETTMDEF